MDKVQAENHSILAVKSKASPATKPHPLMNLNTFSIALRHTIMKKVTTNKLKSQTFGGMHIKVDTPTRGSSKNFKSLTENDKFCQELFAELNIQGKSKEVAIVEEKNMKRRKGKFNNNYAVFSNDIYANFLKIKEKAFDLFLKLIEIYKKDRLGRMEFTFEQYSYRQQ